MRLIRIEAAAPDRPALEFHPYVTVVAGLTPAQRNAVAEVVRAVAAGQDPGGGGLLEAHGVILDLDGPNLQLLEATSESDVVLTAADLAGAESPEGSDVVAGVDGPAPETDPLPVRLVEPVSEAGLSPPATSDESGVTEEALDDLHREIEEAEATLAQVEELVAAERRVGATESAPDGPARRAELERRRDELVQHLATLDEIDLDAVRAALDAVPAPVDRQPSPEAQSLADELEEVREEREKHEAALEAEGRGPNAAARRVDAARAALAALEEQQAAPAVDLASADELEALHDEVLEAEQRVNETRLGGRGARKQLDEALARENEVLQQMGFPTYSAYVMARTAPAVDHGGRDALEAARQEVSDAQEAYGQITREFDDDAVRVLLREREQTLVEAAVRLVGPPAELDLIAALRAHTVTPGGAEDPHQLAIDTVVRLLAARGVDFGDLELASDEVVDVGRAWVAEMEEARGERDAVATELEAVAATLESPDDAPAEPEEPAVEPPPPIDDDPRVLEARARLESALVRWAEQHEAPNEAPNHEGELAALVEPRPLPPDGSAAEVLLHGGAVAVESPPSPAPVSAPTSGQASGSLEQAEWRLLTQLAAQRSVSFAGSVPVLLDGALDGFNRNDAVHLLEELERMAEAVQVVVLSGEAGAAEWAESVGIERAAVVAPE